ncbi:MAG: VWA domain-containing protein [Myxococcales bacterium]|nr:VWA domain-containing protein [Myxococcales bacterium]
MMGAPAARWPLMVITLLIGCADGTECGEDVCGEPGEPIRTPFGDAGPPAVEAEEACAMQSTRAVRGIGTPVDVIFVIDNSGSMTDEIEAVRRNINDNFAGIIEDSGVDFRVIMLSLFGSDGNRVCVDPPLAGNTCDVGVHGTNNDRYFHYSLEIASLDPFCRILDSFDQPDPEGRAPGGWQAWLRPEAEKAFVLITDDSARCSHTRGEYEIFFGDEGADPFDDALAFHQALIERSPEQFGEPPDVRYRFHSIVGLQPGQSPTAPLFPHEAVQDSICDTAASPGRSYQALSVVTDALRYPVCEGRGFDAVFQVLASNVVESAKAECVFEIPQAPPGQGIDLITINVEYTPGDGAAPQRFTRADDDGACDARGFTIEANQIRLCSEACEIVEADRDAEVDVLYACVVSPD